MNGCFIAIIIYWTISQLSDRLLKPEIMNFTKRVFVVFFLTGLTIRLFGQVSETKYAFQKWLFSNHCNLTVRLNQYDYNHYDTRIAFNSVFVDSGKLSLAGVKFDVSYSMEEVPDNDDAREVTVVYHCTEGSIDDASLSVDLNFSDWSPENFVLMPGVVYDGNKSFKVWKSPDWYPFITDPRYIGPDKEPFVTDIPRLDRNGGVSRIQMRSGHMTTPSIGFLAPAQKRGFWLLTDQGSRLGDYGIDIEENRSRTEARISLTAPVVREVYRYHHMNNQFPSGDPSASFKKGDELTLKFQLHFFDADEIQSIYNKYADIRKSRPADRELTFTHPFSYTFDILEKKYNVDNWDEQLGFYKFRPDFFYKWQIGWMGGAIFTYPLLLDGNKQSQERVIRMMDWLFDNGISHSGYFWDSSIDGKEFHGIYREIPVADTVTLVRCNGDGLYYAIKHFLTMKKLGIPVKAKWEEGTRGVAKSFMKTWDKDGQLGQYVGQFSGRVVVGGSASGAIVPAALVQASEYFNDREMLEKACEIGEFFYQNFTKKGITYGGPGDALQNPDCESSFGLVESFTQLYESTGDKKWLNYAENAARQFSTWVLSYNFKFPENSFYGKWKIKPMGAVFANPQNGTGTPAICTYSGVSLLNLSRYTGNLFYAGLLMDIAHNLPQYLSTTDRMINPKHEGWMCERVVTADWLEDIGEIGFLSTWCEASLALTYSEVPGIYINMDTHQLFAFDNVAARIMKITTNKIELQIYNPTKQQAEVKVFLDDKQSAGKSVGSLSTFQIVSIKGGESKVVQLAMKP
jgi:hypothetical protein